MTLISCLFFNFNCTFRFEYGIWK